VEDRSLLLFLALHRHYPALDCQLAFCFLESRCRTSVQPLFELFEHFEDQLGRAADAFELELLNEGVCVDRALESDWSERKLQVVSWLVLMQGIILSSKSRTPTFWRLMTSASVCFFSRMSKFLVSREVLALRCSGELLHQVFDADLRLGRVDPGGREAGESASTS